MSLTALFLPAFLSAQYAGTPFHDSRYAGGQQRIPGKVYCAYYDFGGEGVAYHDSDASNHGSGELNPSNGIYLNEFRKAEGVDISYTKPVNDDSDYDKVKPPLGLLYVGWTQPGEWFNMTVDVAASGEYSADLLYTSNRGGVISLAVDGKDATGPLTIESTADPADPIAWRQWHHWNLAKNLTSLKLAQGKHVLTVHVLKEGQMNFAYFDLQPAARKR